MRRETKSGKGRTYDARICTQYAFFFLGELVRRW